MVRRADAPSAVLAVMAGILGRGGGAADRPTAAASRGKTAFSGLAWRRDCRARRTRSSQWCPAMSAARWTRPRRRGRAAARSRPQAPVEYPPWVRAAAARWMRPRRRGRAAARSRPQAPAEYRPALAAVPASRCARRRTGSALRQRPSPRGLSDGGKPKSTPRRLANHSRSHRQGEILSKTLAAHLRGFLPPSSCASA
jgi:hypothetical protein